MAGYSRQSVADIIASAVIKAAPVNAEYNALRDAFAFSGGHKHDGSSTEGAYVPLIADTDAKNKVVVDTTNNRIGIFVEVGGAAVEQVRIQDGAIVPVTDDDIDLGATGAEFKNLYVDGIGYIDSVVITGGNIDGTTIGATTPAAADFTTVDTTGNTTVGGTLGVTGTSTFTGTTTHATVDINGGTIDGTTIGASSAAAGSFTTVSTSGQATLATADINGGTIDGAVIGGASAQAITGTTITANTGFTGGLTGNVTGNVTGNLTGDVTGDVTGDLTGNVTASTGTTTLNNLVVNGTVDFTSTALLNVSDPTSAQHAATKNYVDTQVSNLVDSAPAALDTLNELAAALGDDADFSTTVTNSIATKLPLAGGTMTGAIAMGTNKVTGLGTPTATADAATKGYVDTADALKLNLSGGTLTGNLVMGSNKVTSTATPTADDDLTRKAYVDSILGSATSAATSAAAAATSATNAATSETNASNSASAAAASYDSFDDRYLGAKSSAPTLDNDGDALITGALYFNSTSGIMYVWDGSTWLSTEYNSSNVDINGGTIDGTVIGGSTPAAISGTTITGTSFVTTGDMTFGDNDKAIFGAGSDLQIYHDGSHSRLKETGTGDFYFDVSNSLFIRRNDTSALMASFETGTAKLYYDNSVKLATTPTGIDVTGTVTADGLTVGDASYAGNAIVKTQVEGSDVGNYDAGLQMRSHNNDFGGTIALESRSGINDVIAFKYHNNSTAGVRAMSIDVVNGDISFYEDTGTTPKFFWDASAESLGIGTSSPAERLHVDGGASAGYLKATNNASTQGIEVGISNAGDGIINVQDAAALRMFTSDTERMRIDSSGNVGIGLTNPSAQLHVSSDMYVGTPNAVGSPSNTVVSAVFRRSYNWLAVTDSNYLQRCDNTDGSLLTFLRGANTVGSVTVTASATSYNTSSDYRLKTDAQPMTGASARVQALKPVNFEWIADGTRVDGFLAHEAQEVVPEAVTGTKDAVDADGNPVYQGIDQSKLVPLLTAALQDALTEIADLKSRVTALEG